MYAEHKDVVEVDHYLKCRDCGRTFATDDLAPPRCRRVKPRIGNHESFKPVYPSVLDSWRVLLVAAALVAGVVVGLKLRGF